MFWVKAVVDWSAIGCICKTCGNGVTSGRSVYLLLDADMKVKEVRCPGCFRVNFPDRDEE